MAQLIAVTPTGLALVPQQTTEVQAAVGAVDVVSFGADPTGALDSTAAINAAIATGKSVLLSAGTYLVTRQLTCTMSGQMILGEGRFRSVVKVTAAFNLSALAVFYANSGEEGPIFRDFRVEFVQPDTSVRASLVAYPPAFKVNGSPRTTFQGLRVEAAMVAFDIQGNNGGSFFDTIEVSAFQKALWIDGELDAIRVSNVHHWPFGLTTNQQAIFNDGSNVGLYVGRCDDLTVNSFASVMNGQQVHFFQGTIPGVSGYAFAFLTDCGFDTYGGGVTVDGGEVFISNSYFTNGYTGSGNYFIKNNGAVVSVANCYFSCAFAGNSTTPQIYVSGAVGSTPTTIINGCQFVFVAQDVTMFQQDNPNSVVTETIISSCLYYGPSNYTPTQPINYANGGRITFSNNRINDQGTGSSSFLKVASDDSHIISNNAFGGRGAVLPASYVSLFWNNNSNVNNKLPSGYLLTVANGANLALPIGVGLFTITATDNGNDTALYLVGAGAATLVAASTTKFVSPTTTPAAGKASVAWNGSNYAIYNNVGASVTFALTFQKTNGGG